ncbi:MAG TPA: hypothetical protein VF084_09960 [Nitrososphaeraceae archaeon]
MDKLYKINYLSSLSFIIIGVLLYVTSYGHQSFSIQESEDNLDTNNNEELTGNDIFSDLSRNLPDINEEVMNEDGELVDSGGPIFVNPDSDELNDNNEIGNSENIVESNEQGTTSKSIEKSFSSGFSDSSKEADIINEDVEYSKNNIESSSSNNKLTNQDEDNNKNIIINNSE